MNDFKSCLSLDTLYHEMPCTQHKANFSHLINPNFDQKRGFVECYQSRRKWHIEIHWQQQKRAVGKFKEQCQLPEGVIPLWPSFSYTSLPGKHLTGQVCFQNTFASHSLLFSATSLARSSGPSKGKKQALWRHSVGIAKGWDARFLLFCILLAGKIISLID